MNPISFFSKIFIGVAALCYSQAAVAQNLNVAAEYKNMQSTVDQYEFLGWHPGEYYYNFKLQAAQSGGLFKEIPGSKRSTGNALTEYTYTYNPIDGSGYPFLVLTRTNDRREEFIEAFIRQKVILNKEEADAYWASLLKRYEEPEDVEGGFYGYGPYLSLSHNRQVSAVANDWVAFAYWPKSRPNAKKTLPATTAVVQYFQVVGETQPEYHFFERVGTEEYFAGLGLEIEAPQEQRVALSQGFNYNQLFKVVGFGAGLLLALGLIFMMYKKREAKQNSFDDVQPFS